ncbi:hypothetical protein L6R52_44415, partial [Myxococcota bacterium]|nr:hypothetical protein [Myxococcota bacterium]
YVLAGRADDVGRARPYAFLRRMLLAEAEVRSDDPPSERRRKLLALVPTGQAIRMLLPGAVPPPITAPRSAGGSRDEHEHTRFVTADPWADAGSGISALVDAFGAAEEGLDPDPDRAALAGFLCAALGVHAPEPPRVAAARHDVCLMGDEVARAFDVLLASFAERRGLVVIVDDAHLLDAESAAVLSGLVRPERGLRVAVVQMALPNLSDRTADLVDRMRAEGELVELEPLDGRACRELVRSLVKRPIEASSLEHLVTRASGNPLYLEQLVRAVQATKVLSNTGGGELELSSMKGDGTDDEQVPPTVSAAVATRIGCLRPELQQTLLGAAVLGETFWAEGVAKLVERDLDDVMIALDNLLLDGFVRRRAATQHRGLVELEFTHAVIRSVALSRVKRRRRQKQEQLAVEWLRSIGETDEATLAPHVAAAGQPEEAVALYTRAAEQSLAIGATTSAASLADEGLSVADSAETSLEGRRALLELAAQTAELSARADAALDALARLEALDG